jgi:hypothetical protein
MIFVSCNVCFRQPNGWETLSSTVLWFLILLFIEYKNDFHQAPLQTRPTAWMYTGSWLPIPFPRNSGIILLSLSLPGQIFLLVISHSELPRQRLIGSARSSVNEQSQRADDSTASCACHDQTHALVSVSFKASSHTNCTSESNALSLVRHGTVIRALYCNLSSCTVCRLGQATMQAS